MDFKGQPINLLRQAKKIFLFFCFSFLFFFLALSLNQAFGYFRNQIDAFETQAQTLKEGLPPDSIAPDIGDKASGAEAPPGFVLTEKPDSLEVPRLSLVAPLIFSKSSEVKEIVRDLLSGVAVYPGSALPDKAGRFLVLGHSAPPGFPKIKYYWVFSRLDELQPDDDIFVVIEKRQYHYRVARKIFLEKGEEIPMTENSSRSALYLITCWPPGRDLRRLAVEAFQVLTN